MATTQYPAQVPANTTGADRIILAQAGNAASVPPAQTAARAQNNNRKRLD